MEEVAKTCARLAPLFREVATTLALTHSDAAALLRAHGVALDAYHACVAVSVAPNAPHALTRADAVAGGARWLAGVLQIAGLEADAELARQAYVAMARAVAEALEDTLDLDLPLGGPGKPEAAE